MHDDSLRSIHTIAASEPKLILAAYHSISPILKQFEQKRIQGAVPSQKKALEAMRGIMEYLYF